MIIEGGEDKTTIKLSSIESPQLFYIFMEEIRQIYSLWRNFE